MNILKLVDITKYYGTKNTKKDVLYHLSYQFNDKGLYIIKGVLGSGKSTLLNVILGFEKPSSGYIVINGKNMCKYKSKDFLKLRSSYATMIYQNCMLLQNFSVIDNLCLPLFIKNIDITQEEAKRKAIGIIKANTPDIDPCSLCRYLLNSRCHQYPDKNEYFEFNALECPRFELRWLKAAHIPEKDLFKDDEVEIIVPYCK